MKATKTLIASAIVAATLSAPAIAVEGLSANIGLTSNYLWRGVTQTDDGAAVQGGIDYAHASGVYVGTWASNVDFGDDASYELDFYAGYAGEVGDFAYDIGYIYYAYPDSSEVDSDNEYDFGEVYGSVSYSFLTVGASYGVNSDDGGEVYEDALYLSADAAFEVAEGLELGLHVGSFSFDDDAGEDYIDYGFSVSKDGFTFAMSDTDLDDDDVKAVVSYSVDFDL
ncbi:hypothetical protein GCM10011369_01470 [Neiella marina]|uniref:Histidine kinase n=1 Tax=Neiella marina TaxID=508461 RepID=A0A8J2U1P6_9GAMM|nr:TorF family putative porin [Neiella marina]GGA63793.1 hypothetical protein GCM10011369_01470 [Neiella marina]